MKRSGWILTLAAATAAVPLAAADLGPGTVVGQVTNTSDRLKGRKIFVDVGGQKWALHLRDTLRVTHAGVDVSIHDIDVGTYVKAQGERIGRLRLKCDTVDIIGDRLAFRKAGVYRKSMPQGYFVPRYLK